jgi:hypothetical protein
MGERSSCTRVAPGQSAPRLLRAAREELAGLGRVKAARAAGSRGVKSALPESRKRGSGVGAKALPSATNAAMERREASAPLKARITPPGVKGKTSASWCSIPLARGSLKKPRARIRREGERSCLKIESAVPGAAQRRKRVYARLRRAMTVRCRPGIQGRGRQCSWIPAPASLGRDDRRREALIRAEALHERARDEAPAVHQHEEDQLERQRDDHGRQHHHAHGHEHRGDHEIDD